MEKAILTCALTGVLTNPKQHPVPVTPAQMAQEARDAFNAGASIMHVHLRNQEKGWAICRRGTRMLRLRGQCHSRRLSWRHHQPDHGRGWKRYFRPAGCIRRIKPEIAACNAGSLNYLKIKDDGQWAWPPMVFDNPVSKVQQFLDVMQECGVHPEFECFDVGSCAPWACIIKAACSNPSWAARIQPGDGRGVRHAL
jgi:3-keto-5-aminohexanoate cleavage enzyme